MHTPLTTRRSAPIRAILAAAVALLLASVPAGCNGPLDPSGERNEGLRASTQTGGPTVVWDIEALPLPEIPFPNDQATRLDPTSPTGRRLNISTEAVTRYESRTRERFNRLDGFGTYAPITVSFDAPLDLDDLVARHRDNFDFRDDAVFVLNVDPSCARFGEEVGLDMGHGRFPLTLFNRARRVEDEDAPGGVRLNYSGNRLFPFDPLGDLNNIVFPERNELGDGREPNFIDPSACDDYPVGSLEHDRCVADNLIWFWERETNTLILRPIWPLEQQCTYAVVLTNRLRGEDGRPIQSPFPAVNPRDQTQALAPVPELLARYDLGRDEIAFAWTFTTGTMTRDLEALRAGLYGHGVFARLAEEFPVSRFRLKTARDVLRSSRLRDVADPDDPVAQGACAGASIGLLWTRGVGEWDANQCALVHDALATGGFFSGSFTAPDLLVDKSGIATPQYPADDDEMFDIDIVTGEAVYGETDVTFFCTLPIERTQDCSPGNPEGMPFCRPFPVVLYGHGYGSSKREALSHVNRHNAMGFAACGIDSYGHGLNRADSDPDARSLFDIAALFIRPWRTAQMIPMITRGRDRDLNNDGLEDPGADMWTANLFHTRDMVRQSAFEVMQLVRILRHMDGVHLDEDGNLLGDITGDGVVDIGGPDNTISMWGISLGGIIAGVLAGAEPSLDAVSPNAGGAGLTDITVRLGQGGLPEAVMLPMLGPFVAGCLPTGSHQVPLTEGEGGNCMPGNVLSGPFPAGELQLAFYAHDNARFFVHPFARVPEVEPGDRIVLRNLVNGVERETVVGPRGYFRISVPTDALNAVERRPVLGLEDGDTEPVEPEDVELLADRLELVVYRGDSDDVRHTVSTFSEEVVFQGTRYTPGTPLVALQEGLAYERNTPTFRRFIGFAQSAIAPADPAIWSAHYFLEPLDSSYDPFAPEPRTRVLVMPTAGDLNVPAGTGVAQGRTAGLFGSWLRDPANHGPEVGWREIFEPDPRFGHPVDLEFVDKYVVEGDSRFERFPDNPITRRALFDIDNSSDGLARYTCDHSVDWSALINENGCPPEYDNQDVTFPVPHPEPGNEVRINRPRGDGTHDAFRIPLIRPIGQHGIYNPQPFRVFDGDAFMVNFTMRFLHTRGRDVSHNPGCDCSASNLGEFQRNGRRENISSGGACTEDRLNLCSAECAEAWGIVTPEVANCEL